MHLRAPVLRRHNNDARPGPGRPRLYRGDGEVRGHRADVRAAFGQGDDGHVRQNQRGERNSTALHGGTSPLLNGRSSHPRKAPQERT